MTLADPGPCFMWTIYEHPADFPRSFVARLWRVERGNANPIPTDTVMVYGKLDQLRDRMRDAGLTRIRRFEHDDPKIVEVWM